MRPVSNMNARRARSRSTNLVLSWARPLAAALAGSLLGACAEGDAAEPTQEISSPAEAIQIFAGIPQHGNVLGSPSAPVTLVELSDLRCVHCRHFAEISLPVLVDRYVRTGKVRIVFENLPILGQSSVQAARMAAAVGLQGHEFEFVEVFFHEGYGPVNDDLLRRIASEVPGVDASAALSARSSTQVDAALAEAKGVAERHAIYGTPSFLLGKTGAEPHVVPDARATKPETLTGPIDELLAQR
jgi:protein-disulfide isomerase